MIYQQYNKIINNIEQAKLKGNSRKYNLWRNKLEKWQLEYGAYQPIK